MAALRRAVFVVGFVVMSGCIYVHDHEHHHHWHHEHEDADDVH